MRRLPHFYVESIDGTWTVLQRNKSGPDLIVAHAPTRREARLTANRLNDRPRYSDAIVAEISHRNL